MNTQETKNYTFSFESAKTPQNIFETLLDVRKWWVGLYGEDIKGSTNKLNDEFTFNAGDGVHYSKQRLIELVPDKKIVWKVTDSNLSFVKKTDEWTNTTICFEISKEGNKSKITFTHQGLVPKFECYNNCSGAWTQYLEKLAMSLQGVPIHARNP
ncbi:MAG: SRPBCC domain-containing protein [Bacteroidia bacterium]